MYMVAPDGQEYTFISNTTGAIVGVDELKERITNTRKWNNDDGLWPIIAFGTCLMPTRYNKLTPRPRFDIDSYRHFGKPAPTVPVIEHIPAETAEPTLGQIMGDEIPDQPNDSLADILDAPARIEERQNEAAPLQPQQRPLPQHKPSVSPKRQTRHGVQKI
jgi:hypothetical protein